MKHLIGTGIIVAALSGCVSTGVYKAQVAKTEEATKQAMDTQVQLDAAKKQADQQKADLDAAQAKIDAAKATETDLRGQLKAAEEKIAVLEKSNKDLAQSLEAKKGDLPKKLAALIKERDALKQKLDTAQATAAVK